jgi:hypothetical protein
MTNTAEQMEEMLAVLKEAQELIETDKDCAGGKIVSDTTPGETYWSYVTKYFMLDAVNPERYLISFTINNYRIEKVAMITHLLTLMLSDHLIMAQDNFVDINTNTVYYGDDAYKRYADDVMKRRGLTVCPVCEGTCSLEMFLPEKGYCRLCERDVIPFVTFH